MVAACREAEPGPKARSGESSLNNKTFRDRVFDVTVEVGATAWGELARMGARSFASDDKQADALGFAANWITKKVYKAFMDKLYYEPSDEEIRQEVRRQASYVYVFRGLSSGRPAWFYVLVRPTALPGMKRALGTGTMDVADYGEVLASGWGQHPPNDVARRIENEYTGR